MGQWLTGSPESGYRWNPEAALQPNTDAAATAPQWASANHVRHALVPAAWLAALKALCLSSERARR